MSWRLRCRSPRSIVRFILRFNRFSDFRNGCAFARVFDRVTRDLETHSSSESHPVPLIDACCRSASYETEFQRLVSFFSSWPPVRNGRRRGSAVFGLQVINPLPDDLVCRLLLEKKKIERVGLCQGRDEEAKWI